jgi:hypothetical protein
LLRLPPSVAHKQFRLCNSDSRAPYTKLILRGLLLPEFYASKKFIWQKKRHLKDKAVFNLEHDVFATDLVVYMLGFGSVQGGLWLLRPAGDSEFSLISCLSWMGLAHDALYDHLV